jgi:hypothetical protein
MTERKAIEDVLAQYTEDLLAERRPRLDTLTADLSDEEREQLMPLLAVVRRLKEAHHDAPSPSEDFLRRLDQHVWDEIVRVAPDASRPAERPDAARVHGGDGEPRLTLGRRIRNGGRAILNALRLAEAGGRWRLATVTLLALVCAVQIQMYRQIHQLEDRNNALARQLEQLSPAKMSPLSLPRREDLTPGEKAGVPPKDAAIEELLARLEFRRKVERRVQDLEQDLGTKTGEDHRTTEILLRELRALLQR